MATKMGLYLPWLSLLVCLNQFGQDLPPSVHDQEVTGVGDKMSLATGQGGRQGMSDRYWYGRIPLAVPELHRNADLVQSKTPGFCQENDIPNGALPPCSKSLADVFSDSGLDLAANICRPVDCRQVSVQESQKPCRPATCKSNQSGCGQRHHRFAPFRQHQHEPV